VASEGQKGLRNDVPAIPNFRAGSEAGFPSMRRAEAVAEKLLMLPVD
jgi:hypothetical protein